jgi:hypothetical protein
MMNIMLRQTASTMRPAVFAGRVFSSDITAAPGMMSSVTTPGRGTRGECDTASATDKMIAVAIQIPVGATSGQSFLTLGQSFLTLGQSFLAKSRSGVSLSGAVREAAITVSAWAP